MRKVIILLAFGVLAASSASAASFWTESFNYADGNLAVIPNVSGGAWVNHSTSTVIPDPYIDIKVVSGEAVLIGANGSDDSRNFTEQSATATTYACFKMKVNPGAEASGNSYIAHFKNASTGFVARVFIFPTSTTAFNIGINSGSTVPSGAAIWPTSLTKGTFYTIAIRYNAQTGVSTLWVSPVSEASPSITTLTTTIGTLVSGFALRQAIGAGSTFDDITVGDTFCPGEVVPTTNSTWGAVKSDYR